MSVLDILTAARAILEEMAPEVRNRCADTTYLRLQGVIQSLDTAGGLTAEPAPGAPDLAEPAPAPAPADLVGLSPATFAELLQVLGDRIAVEVRMALDEARATATAPAPQG